MPIRPEHTTTTTQQCRLHVNQSRRFRPLVVDDGIERKITIEKYPFACIYASSVVWLRFLPFRNFTCPSCASVAMLMLLLSSLVPAFSSHCYLTQIISTYARICSLTMCGYSVPSLRSAWFSVQYIDLLPRQPSACCPLFFVPRRARPSGMFLLSGGVTRLLTTLHAGVFSKVY